MFTPTWSITALLAGAAVIGLCVALIWWWFRGEASIKRRDKKILRGDRVGVYFNPFVWNPLAPLFVCGVVWSVLYLVTLIETRFGFGWLNDPYIFWVVFTIAILLIISSRGESETVPPAHVALLTILGMRFRFYRSEGTYYFARIPGILDRYRDPKKGFTDSNAFIKMGELQFSIWDTFTEIEKERSPVLNLISRETAAFYANLLLVVQVLDPYRITTSEDPLLDVADRARSALRTAASFFTVRDNAAVRDILGVLMSGHTILTCFLNKQVGSFLEGSVVQDKGGVPMYHVVNVGETTDEEKKKIINNEKATFIVDVKNRADPSMLAAVVDEIGEPWVEERSVDASLDEVVVAVGATLKRATIPKIATSEDLRSEADRAAREGLERDSQLRSAKTIKAAREELLPTDAEIANPGFEIATYIAAAKDAKHAGDVKIIHVGGGDRLSRAGAILGAQIGDKS